MLGTNILEIVHPEEREKAWYRINERRTGKRCTKSMELRLLTKEKETVHFEKRSRGAQAELRSLRTAEQHLNQPDIGGDGGAIDRATYCAIDPQGKIRALYSLQPQDIPNITGLRADLNKAPGYLSALLKNDSVIVIDVSRDLRLKPLAEIMAAGHTRALLDIPVIRSNGVVGLLCFDSPQPRVWSELEIACLTEIAMHLRVAFQSISTWKANRQAEERSAWLAEEWETTFNSLDILVSIHDKDFKLSGIKRFLNPAFS